MKAGTTSLWEYLRAHPQIFMSEQKELQFFSEHEWWRGLDWYRSVFERAGDAKAIGEASPSYTRHPFSSEARDRIAEVLPDARLVYVVRHPIERIVSQVRHETERDREHRPLDEAALDEEIYVSTSRYAMQAERYLERFPPDRLLIITTEALAEDTVGTMARVYEFLGVDPGVQPSALRKQYGTAEQRRTVVGPARHLRAFRSIVPPQVRRAVWRVVSRPVAKTERQPELSPAVRDELVERLRPDLLRLRQLVGGDFDCWGLLGEADGIASADRRASRRTTGP